MSAEQNFPTFCARCHGDAGAGDGPIGLYLDPSPRDLTKATFMNSKTPERFLDSIQKGVPGTSMPPWEKVLDEAKSQEILDYVLSTFVTEPRRELRPRKIPERNPVTVSDESIARGEAIYLRRCTGCHGLNGDGKGPNSPDILPRPRNLRNAEFVGSLNDRRILEAILYGVRGTAMPPWIDYGLSQNDAGDIVNYKWTIITCPEACAADEGKVIREMDPNCSLTLEAAMVIEEVGLWTIELEVSDSEGNTSRDSVRVEVSP